MTNVRVKIAEARGVYYELGDALDTLKKQEPDASKHAEEFLALAQRYEEAKLCSAAAIQFWNSGRLS